MPLLSRSLGRKVVATLVASTGFVFVYETTIRDSRYAARQAMLRETTGIPMPGERLQFSATAYCKGTTTKSGVGVRRGVAAADPNLLPVGSVISVVTGDQKYNGVYTIMDTGPAVQGRILDLYMRSCYEALAFGRKQVEVTVLRLGWNPRASGPGLIETLFRRRETAPREPQVPAPTPPSSPEPSSPPPAQESVAPETGAGAAGARPPR
jgi:3D (Asp-Asp-Asp) domain-containing protein